MKNVAALTLILTALCGSAFPQDGASWFDKGAALNKEHKYAEARDAFQHSIALHYRAPMSMLMVARTYALAGDEKQTQAWIEKAASSGFAMLIAIDTEPSFLNYRGEPWFRKARAQMETNAKPCLTGANYKDFDFWLGEWDVETKGRITARSRIEKIADGCIVQENWMPYSGVEGKSWNFYNAATKKWEQTWMSAGQVLKLEGELRDGAMRYTGRTQPASGPAVEERLTFTPLPQKRVHQFWEQSHDGGKTWSVAFDGIYIPRK